MYLHKILLLLQLLQQVNGLYMSENRERTHDVRFRIVTLNRDKSVSHLHFLLTHKRPVDSQHHNHSRHIKRRKLVFFLKNQVLKV